MAAQASPIGNHHTPRPASLALRRRISRGLPRPIAAQRVLLAFTAVERQHCALVGLSPCHQCCAWTDRNRRPTIAQRWSERTRQDDAQRNTGRENSSPTLCAPVVTVVERVGRQSLAAAMRAQVERNLVNSRANGSDWQSPCAAPRQPRTAAKFLARPPPPPAAEYVVLLGAYLQQSAERLIADDVTDRRRDGHFLGFRTESRVAQNPGEESRSHPPADRQFLATEKRTEVFLFEHFVNHNWF